ncbi:MAG: hypothetical protein ACOYKC_09120 [Anaerolineaceae bacterium]|jgi:hypothetical protein
MSDFDNSCGSELILPDSLREVFHGIDRAVAKAMKQVKEPFSLEELFEKMDINKKISLLREASFETGLKIGIADYSDMSDKIDDVISLEKEISLLLLDWEAETKMLQKESLEAEELRDLLDSCGFKMITDEKGNKGFRNGSIDYFPRAVLDK